MTSKRKAIDMKHQLKVASTAVLRHPNEMVVEPQSSKDIKMLMKETRRSCAQCSAFESEANLFKTCSKCQAVFYCSKECQKLHWPAHKVHCPVSRNMKRIEKLAGALTANRNFFVYLKLAIILQFELCDAPLPIEPFCVLVPLLVEPEDILDFARLRGDIEPDTATDAPKKIKGMLQVGSVVPYPEEQYFKDKAIFVTQAAIDANPSGYASGSILAVIRFSLLDPDKDGPGTTMQVPITIQPNFLAIAKANEPFLQIVHATGESQARPMSAFTCIEYINTAIRQDKENRFLMRTDMTATDEQIIRKAARELGKDDASFASSIVELRMRNEYIYRPLVKGLN